MQTYIKNLRTATFLQLLINTHQITAISLPYKRLQNIVVVTFIIMYVRMRANILYIKNNYKIAEKLYVHNKFFMPAKNMLPKGSASIKSNEVFIVV